MCKLKFHALHMQVLLSTLLCAFFVSTLRPQPVNQRRLDPGLSMALCLWLIAVCAYLLMTAFRPICANSKKPQLKKK